MNEVDALDLMRMALATVLLASAPAVGAAMLVGVVVALFQALTQIQEATLTFVPKIVGILVTGLVALPWVLRVMLSFTRHIFDVIAGL